jgi:hypothetical protein
MSNTPRKAASPDAVDDESLVRRFDAGEQIWEESDEVVDVQVRIPLDKVVPIRLTADNWRALYREARELGVGPSTLARMWLIERLRATEAGRKPTLAAVGETKATYSAAARKAARGSVAGSAARKKTR